MYFAAVVDCLNDGVTFVRLIEWPHSAIDDSSSNHTIDQTAANFLHIFFFLSLIWPFMTDSRASISRIGKFVICIESFTSKSGIRWVWRQLKLKSERMMQTARFICRTFFCFAVPFLFLGPHATYWNIAVSKCDVQSFIWLNNLCVRCAVNKKKKVSASALILLMASQSTSQLLSDLLAYTDSQRKGGMEKILPRRKFANSFTTSIQLSIDIYSSCRWAQPIRIYRTFIPIQTSGVQP